MTGLGVDEVDLAIGLPCISGIAGFASSLGEVEHDLPGDPGLAPDEVDDGPVGHGAARKYIYIIGAFATFIFMSNIFGLFYFLQPPTGNTNTTFGLGLCAFAYYNWQGVKTQGLGHYLAHFAGPMPLLAPLGDFAEVSRPLVVTAWSWGAGIARFVTPTSAVVRFEVDPPAPAVAGTELSPVLPALGACEVIVYSPQHDATLAGAVLPAAAQRRGAGRADLPASRLSG